MTARSGAELIAAERRRQIETEGWTAEHDDRLVWQLPAAARAYMEAATYAEATGLALYRPPAYHPGTWAWKPTDDPIRMLVKAGALIAAEIDRLQRLEAES